MTNRIDSKGILDARSPYFIGTDPVTGILDNNSANALKKSGQTIMPIPISSNTILSTGGVYYNATTSDWILTLPAGLGRIDIIHGNITGALKISMGTGTTSIKGISSTSLENPFITLIEVASGVYRTCSITAGSELARGITVIPTGITDVEIQAAHDMVKAAGGGTVVLDRFQIYTISNTINWDSGYVSLEGNFAKHDITPLESSSGVAYNIYSSVLLHTITSVYGQEGYSHEFRNLYIYGGDPTTKNNGTATTGTVAIKLDSTTADTSNRMQFINPIIVGCTKAWTFTSRSYAIRIIGGHTMHNTYGVYTNSGTAASEIIAFNNHMFVENGSHVYDAWSQIIRFNECHFDYHQSGWLMYLKGSSINCWGCHFEWNYGDNTVAGLTTSPFTLDGAGGHLTIKDSIVAFQDQQTVKTWSPLYTATFSTNDKSQIIDLDIQCYNLGRRDTSGLDCLVYCNTAGVPIVRAKLRPGAGGLLTDLPAITLDVENAGVGTSGILRDGIDEPYNELLARTAFLGSGTMTATADSGNTGNGTMGTVTATDAKVGTHIVEISAARANAGYFRVIDPDGIISIGTVGVAYSKHGLAFTIADGTTDFIVGDRFSIVVTGCSFSDINATDGGVTQKNSFRMIRINGTGKCLINFPVFEPNRRHAWRLFTAQSTTFTGTATIKQRQGGFFPRFNGDIIDFIPDSHGVNYGANTINITTASQTWVKRNWKDVDNQVFPRLYQSIGGVVLIEINTAAVTAGNLYLSYVGYDIM